jgi:hypothetical protein
MKRAKIKIFNFYFGIITLSKKIKDFFDNETLKEQELEIDELGLEIPIKIKGKIIKTFGELRKYATSTRNIRKMEH